MVRWLRWHCPPDTGFEIRALAVRDRARYLSVAEAPHNTDFHTWMGKKHFCFFQTAETGNRTPNSGVKGSGANHYPRAPALTWNRLEWLGVLRLNWTYLLNMVNMVNIICPLSLFAMILHNSWACLSWHSRPVNVNCLQYWSGRHRGHRLLLAPIKPTHWPNVVLLLGRRRRRRANIKTILGQRLVFAGQWLEMWTLCQQRITI